MLDAAAPQLPHRASKQALVETGGAKDAGALTSQRLGGLGRTCTLTTDESQGMLTSAADHLDSTESRNL